MTSAQPTAATTSYGQVIEYIHGMLSHCLLLHSQSTNNVAPDRLYLASYTHAPDRSTPFPYPMRSQSRSPTKRSSRAQQAGPTSLTAKNPPVYFSIDKSLLYNAFHADFGPLHIGHLYRFAVTLHEVLADPKNTDRFVVFWSDADSRSEYCSVPFLCISR